MRLGGKINWTESASTIAPQIRADGVHIWPFDPAFPVAVTYQVFGERQPVRTNRHDYFEIVYVMNGEITCQVADRCFVCRQGELIVIGSALYHRMWRHTRAHPKIATLFFMPEVICEAGGNGEHAEFLMPFYLQEVRFPFVVRASTGLPADILGVIHRIHSAIPATTNLARLSVRTYLKMALILLVNHYSAYISSQRSPDPKRQALGRIAPLFEFLETHYNQAISVEDAAGFLGVSKPHFMRLFKQVTGQSFVPYLNHFRIAKAQALLTSSRKPIAELSQEVGFCDQSYFGSVFRKTVRMTPLTYRRRFGNSMADSHIHNMIQDPWQPREDVSNCQPSVGELGRLHEANGLQN
jgi:AraC-like DNA-binding protein